MIRKAILSDIEQIVAIYDNILALQEKGDIAVGWKNGIYPTKDTAITALENDELYVLVDAQKVVASAIINQTQVECYKKAKWRYLAKECEVMVLHTLVVDTSASKCGYGSAFVKFYEELAKEKNCKYLRMDTNAININARKLYKKLGYNEVGIVECYFNNLGLINLVCLEKAL